MGDRSADEAEVDTFRLLEADGLDRAATPHLTCVKCAARTMSLPRSHTWRWSCIERGVLPRYGSADHVEDGFRSAAISQVTGPRSRILLPIPLSMATLRHLRRSGGALSAENDDQAKEQATHTARLSTKSQTDRAG